MMWKADVGPQPWSRELTVDFFRRWTEAMTRAPSLLYHRWPAIVKALQVEDDLQ